MSEFASEDWVKHMAQLEEGHDVAAGVPEAFYHNNKYHERYRTYSSLLKNLVSAAHKAQRENVLVELRFMPRYSDKSFVSHASITSDLDVMMITISEKHHVCASWDFKDDTYTVLIAPKDE